jgi:prophage antirepressor-like protein
MTGTALGASAPTIFQFRSTEVRTLVLDGEVWFVASDVAKALGYTHAPHMLRVLDEDEKGVQIVDTLGGPQELGIISESGLYHAVLKSRKPEAKPFRKWVTAEVLPAIRKTGQYVAQPRADTPADLREVWPVTMATPPGFGYMVATRSQKAKRQPRRIGVSA